MYRVEEVYKSLGVSSFSGTVIYDFTFCLVPPVHYLILRDA
jgi:hypothetical protein